VHLRVVTHFLLDYSYHQANKTSEIQIQAADHTTHKLSSEKMARMTVNQIASMLQNKQLTTYQDSYHQWNTVVRSICEKTCFLSSEAYQVKQIMIIEVSKAQD